MKLQRVVTNGEGFSKAEDVAIFPCNENPRSMFKSPAYLCVDDEAMQEGEQFYNQSFGLYG